MDRRIVIGIGHPDRGDDAVGRIVARRLSGRTPAGVTVIEHDGEATSLLEALGAAEEAILIDAALSGEPAGTVRRFDAAAGSLRVARFGVSSHGFGLAEAVELARMFERLPPRCVIYAVEAASFAHGAGLSPPVRAAVDGVVGRILGELSQHVTTDA